jgi:hypothetical protein
MYRIVEFSSESDALPSTVWNHAQNSIQVLLHEPQQKGKDVWKMGGGGLRREHFGPKSDRRLEKTS